jgi:hypothetical protein
MNFLTTSSSGLEVCSPCSTRQDTRVLKVTDIHIHQGHWGWVLWARSRR